MSIPFSYLVGTASQALEKKRQRQIEEQERASEQEMEILRRSLLNAQIAKLGQPEQPSAPEPFTLSPGQQRFGPDGKLIAEVPGDAGIQRPVTLAPGGALVSPTGEIIAERAAAPEKPKEPDVSQRRSAALLQVAEQANTLLDGARTPTPADIAAERLPFGAGNYWLSEDRKRQRAAGSQLVAAYLYAVSGATVTPQEAERQARDILPEPNDGPEVLAQKAAQRRQMLDAIRGMAGPAALVRQSPPSGAVPPAVPTAPAGRAFDDFLPRKP